MAEPNPRRLEECSHGVVTCVAFLVGSVRMVLDSFTRAHWSVKGERRLKRSIERNEDTSCL